MDEEVQRYRLENVAKPTVDFVEKHAFGLKGRRWLDVAAGNGDVLAEAARRGWEPTGVEINSASVEYAKRFYSIQLEQATLQEFCASTSLRNHFNVVSLFGYLDITLVSPIEEFRLCHQLLRENGLIAMRVPNYRALTTVVQKTFPDQLVCRHLYPVHIHNLYTPESICYAMNRVGPSLPIWMRHLPALSLV